MKTSSISWQKKLNHIISENPVLGGNSRKIYIYNPNNFTKLLLR